RRAHCLDLRDFYVDPADFSGPSLPYVTRRLARGPRPVTSFHIRIAAAAERSGDWELRDFDACDEVLDVRSTLTDIAREAGVSPATVDRVLNNRPGVRARTREIVIELAQRLG